MPSWCPSLWTLPEFRRSTARVLWNSGLKLKSHRMKTWWDGKAQSYRDEHPRELQSQRTAKATGSQNRSWSLWPVGSHLAWGKWRLGASPVAQVVKNPPTVQETRVRSLGQKDPLEKEMTIHSSILALEVPWTEEPGGQWGSKELDATTYTHTHASEAWGSGQAEPHMEGGDSANDVIQTLWPPLATLSPLSLLTNLNE